MRFDCISQPSDELIKNALSAYQYDHSSSFQEEMKIRQIRHAEEHGEFSFEVSESNDMVECTMIIDGEKYSRMIPKQFTEKSVEVYPIGEIVFESIELVAINAVSGFPWTDEAFNAWYLGDVKEGELDDEDEWFERVRIFNQYYPPRGVTKEPPECTVLEDGDDAEYDFMAVDIQNATQAREPNPWAYAALIVLYENEELAEEILSHDNAWKDRDTFELTPPEIIPSKTEP